MKKTLVAMIVMVMGLSMTASALPELTYTGTCQYDAIGTALFPAWVGVLGLLEVVAEDADASLVDLELPTPDGIPDQAQIALMTSAMCADPTLLAGFGANVAAMDGMLGQLDALIDLAEADLAAGNAGITNVGAAVYGFVSGNQAAVVGALMGVGMSQADAIAAATLAATWGQYVYVVGSDMLGDVRGYRQYHTILNSVKQGIAGVASLSTAAATTQYMVFSELFAGLMEPVSGVGQTPAQIFGFLAVKAADVAQVMTVAGQEAYAPAIVAVGNFCGQLSAATAALQAPEFAPITVGSAKAITEPFSATGDYDGDGVSNLVAWNGTGDVAGFVAAASGTNPYYTGNTNLPAVGLVGLAALIGAMSAGGAFVLRKK